jgi:hypothetical protein
MVSLGGSCPSSPYVIIPPASAIGLASAPSAKDSSSVTTATNAGGLSISSPVYDEVSPGFSGPPPLQPFESNLLPVGLECIPLLHKDNSWVLLTSLEFPFAPPMPAGVSILYDTRTSSHRLLVGHMLSLPIQATWEVRPSNPSSTFVYMRGVYGEHSTVYALKFCQRQHGEAFLNALNRVLDVEQRRGWSVYNACPTGSNLDPFQLGVMGALPDSLMAMAYPRHDPLFG